MGGCTVLATNSNFREAATSRVDHQRFPTKSRIGMRHGYSLSKWTNNTLQEKHPSNSKSSQQPSKASNATQQQTWISSSTTHQPQNNRCRHQNHRPVHHPSQPHMGIHLCHQRNKRWNAPHISTSEQQNLRRNNQRKSASSQNLSSAVTRNQSTTLGSKNQRRPIWTPIPSRRNPGRNQKLAKCNNTSRDQSSQRR